MDIRRKAIDRRRFILTRAAETGHIGVSEMAGALRVSMETVRRDLAVMEANGLMRRTYGGAYPVNQYISTARPGESMEDAGRIAQAGVDQIGDAQSIYLDDGSLHQAVANVITERRLAHRLGILSSLVVLTPSLTAASLLARAPGVSVVMLGGLVRPETLATLGETTFGMIGKSPIDVAFMEATGVSVAGGATTEDRAISKVKSRVMSRARRRILLADQARFGLTSRCRFAGIGDFDYLITSSSLLAHEAKQYTALGPHVIRV